MKKPLLLSVLFSFLSISCLFGQTRVILGRLVDRAGDPLVGATILVKGTNTGTITDFDGAYSIKAPVGAILVISYTGYSTREVVVPPEQGTEPPVDDTFTKVQQAIAAQRQAENGEAGVATMGTTSPAYAILDYYRDDDWSLPFAVIRAPYQIFNIRYVPPGKAAKRNEKDLPYGGYVIDAVQRRKFGYKLRYTTSLAWNSVGKLPPLQRTYAQGRSENGLLTWRGPESGELFSWGPSVSNLEYDGSAYPFDPNGRLELIGTGNGRPAQVYDPYALFKTGSTTTHNIDLRLQFHDDWLVNTIYDQRSENGAMPGAKERFNHFRFDLEKVGNDVLNAKYHFDHSRQRTDLGLRGGNLARLFYSMATTPPSFDNANGYEPTKAAGKAETFTTFDDGMRSYNPGQTANPYFLINKDRNTDRQYRTLQYVDLSLNYYRFRIASKLSYERSDQTQQFATFAPGEWLGPAHSANRNRQLDNGYAQLNFWTEIEPGYSYDHRFEARLTGEFFYDEMNFHRRDISSGISSGEDLSNRRTRRSAGLQQKISYHYDNWLNVDLQNYSYTSSTLKDNYFFNPMVGLSLHKYFRSSEILDHGRLFSSLSRTISELPVSYTSLAFNTLDGSSDRFNQYFEDREVFYQPGLLPERAREFEVGAEVDLFSNRIQTSFTYYHSLRENAIFPSLTNAGATLVNGADLSNRGIEATVNYLLSHRFVRWSVELNFSRYRSRVEQLHVADEEIPIAGFTDIHKSLIAGQPVGVLVGTRFARNAAGNTIIGPDGFPLVDDRPGIIGDPNPDWMLDINNVFTWKGIGLSFLISLQKGGDVWNGTQNVLNYHGSSQLSGQLRNVRNYIFPGVTEGGAINNTEVDLFDPEQDITENRWVRYGLTGVAEAAIADGTSLRFREIALDYTFPDHLLWDLHLSKVSISLFAKNLFLITAYRGVDPGTALFGYEHGRGLDLFNFPNLRSVGLKLHVSL